MKANDLFKRLPVQVLWQILRIFRFATRMYEQAQAEYYARLPDHGVSMIGRASDAIPAEELRPGFVLSTGRCGTKTLAALADLIPDVDSHHEPDPKLLEASYLYFMKSCASATDDFWQGLLAGNRDDLIRQAVRSGKIYFETNNRLALLSELLVSRYPGAKFLHIVRHPCDFVRSAMRRNYFNNHPWDFVRITPSPEDSAFKTWSETGQMEKCAWLWAETNTHIDAVMRNIPSERRLFVRSEDIFNNYKDSVAKLFSFVATGKKMPNAEKIEKVLGMKLNQQTYGKFPKSGDWSPEEKEILKHHCGTLLDTYEYDF